MRGGKLVLVKDFTAGGFTPMKSATVPTGFSVKIFGRCQAQ
jgi:hypothetical protein